LRPSVSGAAAAAPKDDGGNKVKKELTAAYNSSKISEQMNNDNANDKIVRDKKPTITAEQAKNAKAFLKRQGYLQEGFMKTVNTTKVSGYGTYDLKTGKLVTDKKTGYWVSFQVNKEIGKHRDYTPEEYDMYVYECVMRTGSVPYLGSYGNPEMTFWTKDKELAEQMAEDYNQKSYFDIKKQDEKINDNYNYETNPTEV
jgi:hypothetical protein